MIRGIQAVCPIADASGLSSGDIATISVGLASVIVAIVTAITSWRSARAAAVAAEVATAALNHQRVRDQLGHRDVYYKRLVVEPTLAAIRELQSTVSGLLTEAGEKDARRQDEQIPLLAEGALFFPQQAFDRLELALETTRGTVFVGVDAWGDKALVTSVLEALDALQDEVSTKLEQAFGRECGYEDVRAALHYRITALIQTLMDADPLFGWDGADHVAKPKRRFFQKFK